MLQKLVFYVETKKKGDSIDVPNAFIAEYDRELTYDDILKSFPLLKIGDYHIRFRLEEGKNDCIWVDLKHSSDAVPYYKDNVWLKVLRVDTLGITSRYALRSSAKALTSPLNPEASHVSSHEKMKPKKEHHNSKEVKISKSGIRPSEPTAHIASEQKAKPSPVPVKQSPGRTAIPIIPVAPRVTQPVHREADHEYDDDDDDDEYDDDIILGTPVDKSLSQLTGTSYDGKSDEVIRAMKHRERMLRKKQEEAKREMDAREDLAKKAAGEKEKAIEQHGNKIQQWGEENGVKRDITSLLASMHTVLWEGSGWKPVNIGDLLTPGQIKINYFKATRVVHPDKTVDCTPEQKLIAERVFDALSQAWNRHQGVGSEGNSTSPF